jgi:hypothetical protein
MSGVARARSIPVHPLLVSIYPVVYLFAANAATQVTLDPIWIPLLLAALIGVAAYVAAALLLRDVMRGALLASLGLALFFSFGHVWNVVGDALIARRWLLAAYALVAVLGTMLIVRGGRWVPAATRAVTILAAIGIVVNLFSIGQFAVGMSARSEATTEAAVAVDPDEADRRDIYYFIFDRFASARTLAEHYGYDLEPFLDELRARGFYIAEESWANYLKTPLSLMSSLDMEYLDATPFREASTKPGDQAPMYAALRERRRVPATLKSLGYEYVHVGSFFEPSATNVDADRTLRYEEGGEFSSALWSTTLLSMLSPSATGDEEDPPLVPAVQRQHTLYELSVIADATNRPGPTYVFAHFLVPHTPYVFDLDGSMPTDAERAERTLDDQYLRQLRWATDRIIEMVDAILAQPNEEEPIIVIQGDEGPFPDAYRIDELNFRWDQATPEELQQKMGILNAYRLPDVEPEAAGLYPSISPVNSFRVIFDTYLGADLPLLDDTVYIFDRQADLYDLHPIARPTR